MHLSRLFIYLVVTFAATLWFAYLFFFEEVPLGWSYVKPYSVVVAGLGIGGLLLEHQLWRRWPLNMFIKVPNIEGTWQAVLQSNYVRPGETESIPPIDCFFSVKQTYSTLKLNLITRDSSSVIVAHSIKPAESGDGYQIHGVYRNEPKVEIRERSQMHRGALVLQTHGLEHSPTSMTGEYWTDRGTCGSLRLETRLDAVYNRFEDAAAAFDSDST